MRRLSAKEIILVLQEPSLPGRWHSLWANVRALRWYTCHNMAPDRESDSEDVDDPEEMMCVTFRQNVWRWNKLRKQLKPLDCMRRS